MKKKLEELNNLLLIHGDEIYLQELLINKIKKKFLKEEGLNYLKIDIFQGNVEEIINFLQTISFSVENKILIVDDVDFLTSKGKSNTKDLDRMIKFIENYEFDNRLIFFGKNKKIDKRKKFYKILKKYGEIIEYSKYKEKDLINWITRYLKSKDKGINYTNARLISQYSGYLEYESSKNLYDVKNELDKLISYTDEKYNIKKENIEKIMTISIDNNIFMFIDNIFERNTSKAYEMLEDMLSNNIPTHYIFYMMVRQIRMLNQVSIYKRSNLSDNLIIKKMKLRSFIYKKLDYQYKLLGNKNIEHLLFKAQEIDRKSKTGLIDMEIGIDILINLAKK